MSDEDFVRDNAIERLLVTPCCRLMWRPNRRMIDNIKKLASLLPDDLGAANLHGLFLAVVIRKGDLPATDRGDVAVTERNGFLRFENNSAVLREALHCIRKQLLNSAFPFASPPSSDQITRASSA